MTTLRKPVRRVTAEPLESYGPNRGRQFVVELAPGDLLTLRAVRRREGVTARLADVYRLILLARSNAQRMAALRERKAKLAAARETRRLARAVRMVG